MLRSLQTVTRNRKTFRSFLNKTSLKSCCQTTPQLISTLFIQQQVSFSSTRLVDELNHDRVSSVVLTSKIDADDPLSHEIYRYDIDFKANCKDIQFAQEGAYLDLTPAMMEKYLPEGGSGEMSNEMKATRKNAFMVRESSKLVCRILDDFAHQIKHGTPSPTPPEGLRYPVELPNWTENPEWDNSKLQVFSHGNKDLVRCRNPTKNGMKIVRGPGSVVEDTFEAIKEKYNGVIPNKIMLTGNKGSGKSGCLTHAVYHARTNGWIAIFIPRGYDHVNGGPFIEPVTEVTGIPDLYDNVMLSAASLRDLWKAHHRELGEIPIRDTSRIKKYLQTLAEFKEAAIKNQESTENKQNTFTGLRGVVLGDEETFEDEDLLDSPILDNLKHFNLSTFEVKTLADICVAGIAFREYAGPAFIDIVEELRELNDPNRPILIAVDQVNFWDMKTVYKYEDKPITVTQLCVPYATKFLSYKKHDSYTNKSLGKNVFCIGASSYFYPISKKELVTYIDSRSSLPLTIHVPCYSHVEFLAACKLYLNTRLIDHGITNQQLLAFRIHVSNNPRLARRDATKFFMPIYSQWATRAFINYVKGQQAEVEEEILKESNDEDFYGFSVDNRVNDMPEIPPYVPNKEVESDPEDIYYPVDVDESKYNLDEEALASLPDAHLEVDVDMTKFTAAEEEQFWKMVEEDEPIDQLIASDLPLPERDLSGKEIKRIQREEVQSKEEEE